MATSCANAGKTMRSRISGGKAPLGEILELACQDIERLKM
jgi:hypothetical protein